MSAQLLLEPAELIDEVEPKKGVVLVEAVDEVDVALEVVALATRVTGVLALADGKVLADEGRVLAVVAAVLALTEEVLFGFEAAAMLCLATKETRCLATPDFTEELSLLVSSSFIADPILETPLESLGLEIDLELDEAKLPLLKDLELAETLEPDEGLDDFGSFEAPAMLAALLTRDPRPVLVEVAPVLSFTDLLSSAVFGLTGCFLGS